MVAVRVWMISAPITLPARLKRPPSSSVPPSVTARIASSSISCPALLASALLTLELISNPARPALNAQNTYSSTAISRARTPATRAARGLWPMARTNSPSAVRPSSSCKAANTAATTNRANGRPSRKPLPR
ncbi:hypothetical protein NB706_003578 [Xanthomonas sacchari]|nr:hypothetical protein [Xanthomonas sacchari]